MRTKTSYKCACCSHISTSVNSLVELTDANNQIVKVFECSRCHSLIPLYQSLKGNQITQTQVLFHERYWSDTDKASLIEERNELANTVNALNKYIGEPNRKNTIIEIGSGRGTMLSALHNAGYTAIGCEPSEKLTTLGKEFLKISDQCLLNFDSTNFFRWIETNRKLKPRVAILWHVLEHFHDPIKVLGEIQKLEHIEVVILQLPLLHKPYIYQEHLFFATNGTLHYIARVLGFDLLDTKIDKSNLFVTAVFSKTSRDVGVANMNKGLDPVDFVSSLTPFSQCLSVRDDSIAAQATMLEERASAMQEMEAMISKRDDSIAAQATMLEERASAMQEMEAMISKRDETIGEYQKSLLSKNQLINDLNKNWLFRVFFKKKVDLLNEQ
ncbi:methyltransferase domain-containing protein [Planktomarina temperata]|nr:methyltransferase domain-containing protein [Planktomarina temperata]